MIGTFWNLCRACPSMPVDKLHSEYRSTYRWHEYTGPRQEVVRQPPQPVAGNKEEEENKFIENTNAPPITGSSEMEPLVSAIDTTDAGEEKIQEESFSKEDKLHSRPFSQHESNNDFRPTKGRRDLSVQPQPQQQRLPDSWFTEVIELRKKAGQYKHRGWGTELVPEHIAELYSKQMGLWEQVSRRSSLSALSLASSTHRPISKEEKEKENNKKSSPTKNWQSTKLGKGSKCFDEYKKEGAHRSRIDNFVRHHLERTTGVGEGGILHSPTREKLEPVIPRKKEDKDTSLSPQKTHYTGRSQSAGSPKRAPPKHTQKTPPPEKRERPKEETDAVLMSEPVVKSPPEPTRVKSPEQIIMRSPEPVNWTVPLDTGKTFTVTQNVSQGDIQWKALSEGKVRSESRVTSLPSQSAPHLNDDKSEGDKTIGDLRCLDEPSFSFEGNNAGEEIMDKANTRFHDYWSTNIQEPSQPSQ